MILPCIQYRQEIKLATLNKTPLFTDMNKKETILILPLIASMDLPLSFLKIFSKKKDHSPN